MIGGNSLEKIGIWDNFVYIPNWTSLGIAAVGDDRAALGLAGVALQAGVRSALASLWYINDNKTPELVEEFYTSLRNPSITKAQALQKAQIKLIEEGNHPAIWSPFILIGNWL